MVFEVQCKEEVETPYRVDARQNLEFAIVMEKFLDSTMHDLDLLELSYIQESVQNFPPNLIVPNAFFWTVRFHIPCRLYKKECTVQQCYVPSYKVSEFLMA
jgi:hypothetical protein